MTSGYDHVLQAFRSEGLHVVERGGDRAYCQAPGHSPADRSVLVSRGEAKARITSFSDPIEDVLAALGLRWADIYDEPRGRSTGRPTVRLTTGQQLLRQRRAAQAKAHREWLDGHHRHAFQIELLRAEWIAAVCNPEAPLPDWTDPVIDNPLYPSIRKNPDLRKAS